MSPIGIFGLQLYAQFPPHVSVGLAPCFMMRRSSTLPTSCAHTTPVVNTTGPTSVRMKRTDIVVNVLPLDGRAVSGWPVVHCALLSVLFRVPLDP